MHIVNSKFSAIAIFALLLVSCGGKQTREANYMLKLSDKSLSFPLDRNTKNFIIALFPYTDSSGKEFLTFQNFGQNQILFYNMNTCQLEFKVKPAYEGPNGVGEMLGYYIHNFDSLFLNILYRPELTIIDTTATIVGKIQVGVTTDGLPLRNGYAISATYQPIEFVDNKLYFVTGCDRWAEQKPITAFVDLRDKSVHALTDFSYPSFPGADNKNKRASVENNMSRCFDGQRFVYSFFFLDDIHVASIDHKSIRSIPVKSRYIDKVRLPDDYGNLTYNDLCENPNYGNLLYDRYRKVYYRIAYPKTEVDKSIKGMELLQYGRKNFSVIILDQDFNIIGETLFPDYKYNSTLMFIREDGLYISDSHYLNPDFSDDILSFKRFDLVNE